MNLAVTILGVVGILIIVAGMIWGRYRKNAVPEESDNIKQILGLIENVWRKYPDMRFCQLLYSLEILERGVDCFYLPNEEVEERIKRAKI